jgi:small subunit ribosomal protein S9
MAVKKVEKLEKAAKTTKAKSEKSVKAEKVVKVAKKEIKKEKAVKEVKIEKAEKIIKEIHPVKSDEVGAKQLNRVKPEKLVPIKKVVNEKYFYAVGRRKASVAQVRLFEAKNATDDDLIVNGRKIMEYFPTISLQNNVFGPLKAVGMQGNVRMTAIVRGGGVTGQVEAVRLGISRALVLYNETLKKSLKDLGFMTRDSRKVERKKPGLKKARKAPQWAKR